MAAVVGSWVMLRMPVVVLLLIGSPVGPRVASAAVEPESTAVLDVEPAQSPTPTMIVMYGTILKYDANARVLTLAASNGTVEFHINETTRIRQHGRRLDFSALARLSGYHSAVRYSERAGQRVVESVHVFRKSERSR